MTERKTTEIKIRVTPSFKARVQGAADAAGVSLTEWLENAANEKMLPVEGRSDPFLGSFDMLLQPDATTASVRESWKYKGG